jgi:NAD(P)-dependent dehydrogenase (short-subunit alcohol dehydrogenase family)
MVCWTTKSRSSPGPAEVSAWASSMNCWTRAPRSSGARGHRWTPSPAWTRSLGGRNAPTKWSAIKAITMRSTRWSPRWSSATAESTSWSTTPAGRSPRRTPRTFPHWCRTSKGAPRSDDDFERTVLFHAFAVQMNLISPLWFAIRVYRQMRDQDGIGCIINVSSGAGHPAGSPTLVSYGAAKSGLNHLTRSLAEEWGPAARVNCVALGPRITDNFRSSSCRKTTRRDRRTSTRYHSSVVVNPQRSAARVSSSLPAQPISSMARRSKSTAACCRACSTTPD